MNRSIAPILTGVLIISTASNIFITKVLRNTVEQRNLFLEALTWEVKQKEPLELVSLKERCR